MPETEELVINTGPLLALIAGVGDLSLLELLYKRVLVSFEVCQKIEAGGSSDFGVSEFRRSSFIEKRSNPLTITPFLRNALDLGEASVIQLALDENIHTVCIDESMGTENCSIEWAQTDGLSWSADPCKKRWFWFFDERGYKSNAISGYLFESKGCRFRT